MSCILALSDLHIGCPASLAMEPVATAWLRETIASEAPISQLVLLGDTLDLFACDLKEAILSAKSFFSAVLPDVGCIGRIVYVPGNHDHHVWSTIRELAIIESLNGEGKDKFETPINGPLGSLFQFTISAEKTPLGVIFPERYRSIAYFKYPVHNVSLDVAYLFHHGHFFDPATCPLSPSILLGTGDLGILDTLNAPWIEGIWYFAGQSTALRDACERGYRFFRTPQLLVQRMLTRLGQSLIRQSMRKKVLDKSLITKIQRFVHRFVRQSQYYVFVFGHTHRFGEYHTRTMSAFNTGGWLVEEADGGNICRDAGILVIARGEKARWRELPKIPTETLSKRIELARRSDN